MSVKFSSEIKTKRKDSILIAPEDLVFSDFTGRKHGATKENIEKMSESMLKHGQLQDIGVRKNFNNQPVVIFGHTRAKAGLLINETKRTPEPFLLRATFFAVNEEEAAIMTILENAEDTRTPVSCIDLAFLIRELESRYGYTQAQIADKLGKHQTQIGQYKKLLELDTKLQDRIVSENIAFSAALVLANISPDDRDSVLDLSAESSEKITASTLEKVARDSGATVKKSIRRSMSEVRTVLTDWSSSEDLKVRQLSAGILEYLNGNMTDQDLLSLIQE